jgi:FtsH-binding integral membrane protein
MVVMLMTGFPSWFLAGYAVLGVIICGVYIMLDLFMLMTPDAISYDDYILGACMLYIDLVRMFLYLLILLGKSK